MCCRASGEGDAEGRGEQVSFSKALPGDICIISEKAIAIYMGDNKILANSAKKTSLSLQDDISQWTSWYPVCPEEKQYVGEEWKNKVKIYRVLTEKS